MLYKTQQANEVNVGIISDALQNSAEAITNQTNRIEDENVGQHVVSSVIVNNVGEDLATMEFENLSENVNNVGEDLATMEFENLSENVNNVEQHWAEFENLPENVNINELDERCIPL
jgi:phage-related protein